MFTGIIEACGQISEMRRVGGDIALSISCPELDMGDVRLGDSIAVNGVCLTVVRFDAESFVADVSHETIAQSALSKLKVGAKVNLEKAMLASSRFGGHIVSGHVDGVATVARIEKQARAIDLWIKPPAELQRYIAHKGSITVDGISLTVNQLDGDLFRLTIIPHSAEQTTIVQWRQGDPVNIEVDVLARYLERLMQFPAQPDAPASGGIDKQFLAQHGFFR
ncbi:riboflavin synthase [Aliagarivorans marinus]|uniref:riboflavin synthase n=1 Tax=Aliagarivorans marinus TaxID=561965 RepID=UPI0004278646|nr:riboflavin synthase [Aliagarivorans marinus]